MGTPNELGVIAPADNDPHDPSGDMRRLRDSLTGRIFGVVDNVSDRNALAAALGVTSDEPLVVIRGDAPVGAQLEYSLNGTDWFTPGVGPVAVVSRNAVLSLPSGDFTPVTFDTEIIDTDGAWSPGVPTRLTAPYAGIYEFFGSGGFVLPAGRVGARVTKAGAALKGGGLTVAGLSEATGRAGSLVRLEAGEWIDFRLYQESGGSLNTANADYSAPVFGFKRVHP